MSRVCKGAMNVFNRTFLPTLSKRTPLFVKLLQTSVPNKNISFLSQRLSQHTPYQKSFNKNFLITGAGISLWSFNKLNSMTVHAQENTPKCSKEIRDLSMQFEDHLKANNLIKAQQSLFTMADNLKEDGDYTLLKEDTNQFLNKTESILIEGIPQEKPEGLKLHILRILMANGMTKSIIEAKKILIPQPYAKFFLALKEHDNLKEKYLNKISELESAVNFDNTKNTPTANNKALLTLLGMIKAILNGEIQ